MEEMEKTVKTVEQAFKTAFRGEAKAALRLKLYAEKATQEGYLQIAHLFNVISFSESIHGTRSLRMLKKLNSTEQNLKNSFESECNIAEVAYGEFAELAANEDNTAAQTIFTQTRDVERIHGKLYKEAMNHLMEERETNYYVCKVCGFVSDGLLPDTCPICNAPKEKFEKFK